MLGNVSPRALRITSNPVVYSGRNNVTRLTLETLSGRRYVPLNANAVTRWVLVFPTMTPHVLIDSAVNPVFTASVGALEVDLSGFALDASVQPCWLIAYDAEHPAGQVLIDNADCVVAFTFRQVSGTGLVPLPVAEYLTDAPADGKVYARKNQAWVEASALVSGVASVNGQSGAVVLTAADVGADPSGASAAAVASHVALPDPHSQYVLDSEKGAANGVASLDGTGKVPTAQLPAVGAPVGSATPQPLGTASAGVATSSSREDHVHALPSAAQVGAIPATEKGAANGVATLDAGSKVPLAQLPPVGAQLGSATPQALGVAAAGTSSNASREDHVHAMPSAANVGAVPVSEKGAASGVATLDTNGLVPLAQLPSVAITDTFVVNSQAAMLALTAQRGDVAIRTDISSSFILQADPASTLANWQSILTPATGGGAAVGSAVPQPLGSATPGVSSNASREDHVHAMPSAANVGAVATSAVGAANGVASLDSGGKVPTAQLPALGAAVGSATPQPLGTTAAGVSTNASREDHVHAVPSAADVGAVATSAVGTANGVASLDATGKVPSAQLPTSSGAPVGSATPQPLGTATAGVATSASREDHVHAMPSKANIGLGNVDNTSDVNKPVSTAQQRALDLKVNTSAVGAVSGVASLGADGKVPTAQLPTLGASVGSATPQALGTASPGVSSNASREDHVHAMPSAADVGAAPSSHVGATGAAHGVVTTSVAGFMAAADKTKLDGIATGATANQTDAYLLNRANHTGSQAISTVTGLQTALDKATFAPVITDATAARTFALTDAAGYIHFTSASPVTATVPSQAAVAWAADTEISLEQNGTGGVTVVAAAGVTINGTVAGSFTLAGRYSAATLKRLAADTWTLIYGSASSGSGGAPVGSATPQPLGTATAGVATSSSREDHVHAMPSKADVGLGNVDNTSDTNKPVSTAQQAALDLKIDKSQIGASDGVASLVGGKVPSAQLPSYVDDVLEYATYSALPATGESGKIYVTLDTNFEYRWSGSAYIQLVASPGTTDAIAEGSVNLYFTQARVRAAVLTGIDTSQNAQITAADTVLAALGKAQGQIGAIQSALDTINGTVV